MAEIPADERSFTIAEFCAIERISLATYYKMQRDGVGPKELAIPGTKVKRITTMARHEWHKRMEKLGQSKAAQLERARRSKQMSVLGKIAIASELHPTNKRKAKKRALEAAE
jgi:hypothetical protein